MKKISHIITMGDSLSDRGTSNNSYVLGCLPLSWLSGLKGTSPQGRFTNGYAWSDRVCAMLANNFLIQELKKKYQYGNDDIADAIITHDPRVMKRLEHSYNLDNDIIVTFNGKDFSRSYNEGGLSSYNYAWTPSFNLVRFITRIILPNLAEKREKLLDYDKKNEISIAQKHHSLVVEWSGANDLITVNARPSVAEVDRAIKERIKNVKRLIEKGYQNFVLFNLPNLALTPRFQNKTGEKGEQERHNAQECCSYFNRQLKEKCDKLQKKYPQCSLDVFDIDGLFTKIYNNPEAYRLDRKKLKQPYKTSSDFIIKPNKTSPATGYMFWDDVHPSADTHALLADEFYGKYTKKYMFSEPGAEKEIAVSEKRLLKAFRACYGEKLAKDTKGFFGHFFCSNFQYKEANLERILRHALHEGGTRTRDVLVELQWFDKKGTLRLNNPALKNIIRKIQPTAMNTDFETVAKLQKPSTKVLLKNSLFANKAEGKKPKLTRSQSFSLGSVESAIKI